MDALPSTMFDGAIRALGVADYEWTVGSEKIRVSSALADMFGFDPDTWTVKRQTELMHPDDRPEFRAALATGFKSGAERVEFTYRMRRAAGEGTGLGLSLSYDIVVKQHGGELTVDSRPGAFTEFVILPRKMATSGEMRT